MEMEFAHAGLPDLLGGLALGVGGGRPRDVLDLAGDVDGAVAAYTDDVEHDVVGFRGGPIHGKDAARGFYEYLTANFRTEDERPTHRYVADDAMILDQMMTGTVTGELLGFPGNGRRVTFRILHVFEFRDDLISRENVWLDGAAIAQQLT